MWELILTIILCGAFLLCMIGTIVTSDKVGIATKSKFWNWWASAHAIIAYMLIGLAAVAFIIICIVDIAKFLFNLSKTL